MVKKVLADIYKEQTESTPSSKFCTQKNLKSPSFFGRIYPVCLDLADDPNCYRSSVTLKGDKVNMYVNMLRNYATRSTGDDTQAVQINSESPLF